MRSSVLIPCLALAAPGLAAQLSAGGAAFRDEDLTASEAIGAYDEECLPERARLELMRLSSEDAAEAVGGQEAAQAAEAAPAQGDVFLGTLDGCQRGRGTGIRVVVDQWPSKVRVGYFPLPIWDIHAKAFVKPGHNHSFEYAASGSGGSGGPVVFRPSEPSAKEASLARVAGLRRGSRREVRRADGVRFGRADGVRFGLEANLIEGTLAGTLISPEAKAGEVPPANPGFNCTGFKATKCSGEAPRKDEKVVVFMRHAAMRCELDPRLSDLGVAQVEDRVDDPNLSRLISSDPSQQAEVVYMSPMARTMHTALLAFKEKLPKAKFVIDQDLVELGGMGVLKRDIGYDVLKHFNADEALLKQYADIVAERDAKQSGEWHHRGHHKEATNMMELNRGGEALAPHISGPELRERFEAWTEKLRQRPEKRVIVVSHKHLLKAGTSLDLSHAQTAVKTFAPDGTWRSPMQPPQCWPEAL